jgi:ribosomal protein L12E/L44/L45/RPP1/RPP2
MSNNKKWTISFKDNASTNDIITVLNTLGMVVEDERLCQIFKKHNGIELKEFEENARENEYR